LKTYLIEIAQLIGSVAEQEERDLKMLGEGIFHMPELAFAYKCGKKIMQDSEKIFGSMKPKWVREVDLGNGGPTDLLFEFDNGKRIAIEFKMRDKSISYERDLQKLAKLGDENTARIFCALIDVFKKDFPDDGRQQSVEQFKGMAVHSIIEPKPSFETKQNWYSSSVTCVVGVWSVGTSPKI